MVAVILVRNLLNIVMLILLLLIMDYRFIGNVPHEIGGVVLALLFIFHNVLNRRWYVGFFKGRQSLRRVLTTLVNLLLVIAMFTVFVTGVLISVTVFAPLGIRSGGILVHDLHQGSAYASLILVAIHLGLHWEMLLGKFISWLHIDGASLSWVIMSRIVSIVVMAYGVYASFTNHIGANLLMQHIFAGWGVEPSLWGFLLDYFAIISCYVGVTYYLMLLLRKKN
ncbi:MAG: hypothetical protein H6Q73_3038 [Firmicutes bacterium]|nr:hypothetical protein [Bacillota bacterium]